ncbi:GNAT family N-acetyltransferase [Variovorax sp. ZS18.2.2]|uniref:GNAT family N-acetyltransferase n=1 Tax=Variovorax sp. ZS18.2.2 TaxID=2971255 RepID=UPI002150907C|nr:GNAT family N-acetyltransferase [Variovorax sp. ZS18.2.2]MCR6480461.1 GNAT family N-acetyltransferase [Variovorax sp. ZS18.2.2]
MHRIGTAVVPATDFTRGELTALWNRAYEGYFVPIRSDEQIFARHLRRAAVDLALSRVITVDGVPCGISLTGRRGLRGYLAGFGIAGAHRRQGLARQLIEAQAEAWSKAGLHHISLEVIAQNTARALYGQAGFEELRTLDVLEGSFEVRSAVASRQLDPTELAAVHTACAAVSCPTWRRELPTVRDAIDNENAIALGVTRGTALVAYAVIPPTGTALLDAAAIDDAAAHDLLDALAAARPGTRWRLVDEPTGSPLFHAATARDATAVIRQIDMALPLHPFANVRPSP